MNPRILFLVCARNGSKGVPHKNVADVGGKPLIHHTLATLRACEFKEHVVLSTDGDPIASTCKGWVDHIIDRPAHLAGDEVARAPVLKHALEEAEEHFKVRYDYMFDFLATSPFRDQEDLKTCLELIQLEGVENVFSVVPSKCNPYFNMVELEGTAPRLVKSAGNLARRQDAPQTYDMNGSIFAWTRQAIVEGAELFTPKTRLHIMPERCGVDVDTPHDLEVLRSLWK